MGWAKSRAICSQTHLVTLTSIMVVQSRNLGHRVIVSALEPEDLSLNLTRVQGY
jgi:hypothetical protein